ncbi:MAG TPA: hypothetical protein VGK23_02385 [Methanomassiliicoccales archaeon]|jgi:hypothetical protein
MTEIKKEKEKPKNDNYDVPISGDTPHIPYTPPPPKEEPKKKK